MEVESIEYSWKWVTADELLSRRACELCQIVFSGTTKNTRVTLYDGENTQGDLIGVFECLISPSNSIKFDPPIYCRRGLYIDVHSYFQGCLVVWRELPMKGRGS